MQSDPACEPSLALVSMFAILYRVYARAFLYATWCIVRQYLLREYILKQRGHGHSFCSPLAQPVLMSRRRSLLRLNHASQRPHS